MKKIALLVLLICFTLPIGTYAKNQPIKKDSVIYFYSSTCNKCRELQPVIQELKEKYKFKILKYNTLAPKYAKLMTKYEKKFNVPKKQQNIIPKVFYKNTFYSGYSDITNNLENEILHNKYNIKTPIFKANNKIDTQLLENFRSYKLVGIISAGLLNGISPCSISMILLFLSIVISNKKILKLGVAFCLGKFTAFLLMGTILYKFLTIINFSIFDSFFKIFMLIFLYFLAMLNLNDFFAAKNEDYKKIKLQLPRKLRKLNNKILNFIKNTKYLVIVSFLLSILVSTGEFLCTGQIYLSTIITIYQANPVFDILSFFYLFIYNIALIIPLLTITLVIYKTNSIFGLSEFTRKNLHIIKLLNIIIYIIIAIIILF